MAHLEAVPRDEAVLERKAAEALHVEILPGTEIMRDVGDVHFTHGRTGDDVLIPHPSSDLKDPLNWSTTWKLIVIINQWVFTFVAQEAALSLAPMYPLLGKQFHLNQSQIILLTGACLITLGYANFIIVPCSNIFGRRFTSLAFNLLAIGTRLWQAAATSHGSFLAARAITGIAAATSETIQLQVVADLFFLHERGFWTGVYFTAYFVGSFIGPIISGNMAQRYGWRSFFWLSAGLSGLNMILLLIAFPETKYFRAKVSPMPFSSNPGSASENMRSTDMAEKSGQGVTEHDRESSPDLQIPTQSQVGKGRPSIGQFNLIQRPDSRWRMIIIREFVAPFRSFFLPIVLWAGVLVAASSNTVLMCNLTESALLSGAPYHWNSSQVGYANFSFVVGGLIGVCTAGPLSDYLARRATKRNNGVREAEMRLPALLPYYAISAVGIIIAAIGYKRRWSWEVILCLGYAPIGILTTTVPTIAVAYAIDSYKPLSGEILVVATVIKNSWGFSQSYWVAPLAKRMTYLTPFMVQFALLMGPAFLTIPLYFYGKKLRRWSKDSSLHRMEML